jgi:UDP-N-acetylmuramoyl-tripeptide--D-alanyl-D-alanine ligase
MTFAVFFAPYITFLFVLIGVKLTAIPAYFRRTAVIKRAAKKAEDSRAVFIGITGSYGKTTVKEFVYELLSTHFRTEKTEDNMNTDLGVAISILRRLKKDTEFFVTEVGSYKKGEIKRITKFVPFSYAILTGLGNQHLDLYGSRENLIDEVTYILYTIPKKKIVYMNYDIPVRKAIARDIEAKHIYYGLNANTDIAAHVKEMSLDGIKAEITYYAIQFEIETTMPGTHIIIDLLPAIALALDLGVPVTKIIKKIKSLRTISGKQSLTKGKNHSIVIDDSASTNLEDLLDAIELLKMYKNKEKIIITQGIMELGVEKRESYKKIMNSLRLTDIKLFTTDNLFGEFDHGNQVITFNDVKSLISKISSIMNRETVILIEGRFSKSQLSSLFQK